MALATIEVKSPDLNREKANHDQSNRNGRREFHGRLVLTRVGRNYSSTTTYIRSTTSVSPMAKFPPLAHLFLPAVGTPGMDDLLFPDFGFSGSSVIVSMSTRWQNLGVSCPDPGFL
jgi:hypothetical protein